MVIIQKILEDGKSFMSSLPMVVILLVISLLITSGARPEPKYWKSEERNGTIRRVEQTRFSFLGALLLSLLKGCLL